MSEGMAVRAEEPSGMAQATAHSNSTSTQTTALFISTSEYELRCELPSRSQLTLPYCMPGLQPEDQTKVQWNSAGQRGWHLTPPYRGPSRTCHYERARNLLPICYHAFSAPALRRISETNPWSFNDSRLMSTFANAPSIAARARADAVVRSDFMFGFVIGFSLSAISATSFARSATLKGTLVACLRAVSIRPSPSAELLAAL